LNGKELKKIRGKDKGRTGSKIEKDEEYREEEL